MRVGLTPKLLLNRGKDGLRPDLQGQPPPCCLLLPAQPLANDYSSSYYYYYPTTTTWETHKMSYYRGVVFSCI